MQFALQIGIAANSFALLTECLFCILGASPGGPQHPVIYSGVRKAEMGYYETPSLRVVEDEIQVWWMR